MAAYDADVIIVGAGLAAACELTDAGRRVLLLDQEPETSLGGQAYWSFGGFFPIVGWAERGSYLTTGHGNSVPRFHIAWGEGPAIVAAFATRAREAERSGRLSFRFRFRHRVTRVSTTDGAVDGVAGDLLEPSDAARGEPSSRTIVGDFSLRAPAVIVTSGGIGANFDLVRKSWPVRLGG